MKKKSVPASFEKSSADKEKKGVKENSKVDNKSDLKEKYGSGAPNPPMPFGKAKKKGGK